MTGNSSRAFTLIELFVVIAVIAILLSIAYPTYTSILERAKITKDMNNLRQVGLAIQTYLNDNDQVLPATTIWPGTTATPALYPKYISTRKVFQSPFDNRASLETDLAPVSYSINTNMFTVAPGGIERNMAKVVSPASTILLAPTYTLDPTNIASWAGTATSAPDLPAGGPAMTKGTHSSGTQINALFCDSHVETLKFGPSTALGSFQDTASDPLGLKHWYPTQ
jgi:prepilin-type N-terminal cleavage/methylation domain-containing protein/prepilin-type processing-associated H-X9-DG protein